MRRNPPLSSETISSSNGGSSKSPSTPTYSSIETPVRKKIIFNTPESPMFTTADKEKIHKQKSDYEVEIAALTQRRNQLRVELKKVRSNFVTQGELTFLKAETRNHASSSNSEEIKDLMNTFVEMVREISACQAQCSILEQKIKDVAKQRAQIVSESQDIVNCLDFSELKPFLPKLPQHNWSPHTEKEELEIQRAQQRLKGIQQELIECENTIQNPNPKYKESALEISRSSEYQWQLKSVGTIIIRNEIQRLQRAVATSDSEIKKLQAIIQEEQKKLSDTQLQQQKEEAEAFSRFTHGKEEFERNIQITDDEINQINLRIRSASESYDQIMEDLRKIDEQKNNVNINNNYDEEKSDGYDSDSSNDGLAMQNEQILYQQLIKTKHDLSQEVGNLRTQVNKAKKKAKLKESKILADIKKLKSKYQSYQTILQQSSIQMNQLDSSSVTDEIQSLIEKIDNSLTELHSVINQ